MLGITPYLFNELRENLPSFTTGILPSQSIEELVAAGHITGNPPIAPDQIQPSSLDLRIGAVAYRIRASFLSSRNARVIDKLDENHLYKLDLTSPTVLERGCAYMVPLMEELSLPADISGKANPKSTTGRLDVFTRLITDYGSEFERVPAGYKGKLYTEIVPRTFSIVVEQGVRLNQLRLRRGNPPPSDSELERLHDEETLVYMENDAPADAIISNKSLWLSVDLSGDDSSDIIGYKARHNTPLIDLARINYYDPVDYWYSIRTTSIFWRQRSACGFHTRSRRRWCRTIRRWANSGFTMRAFSIRASA